LADVILRSIRQERGRTKTVNVIAITNAYFGCAGNPGGVTPTVEVWHCDDSRTATSAVPKPRRTVLYVLICRRRLILHAINVNNIIATPGAYNSARYCGPGAYPGRRTFGPANEQLFR